MINNPLSLLLIDREIEWKNNVTDQIVWRFDLNDLITEKLPK